MLREELVQSILARVNIVEVVGDFCDMRKKGKMWECLCPFHEDRHIGSFKIDENKGTFVCYSCGARGDAVEFLMKHEGLSFPKAIRWLGRKYSIDADGESSVSSGITPKRKKAMAAPMSTFPMDMVTSRQDLRTDILSGWLKSLPWNDEQRARVPKVLEAYKVGMSKQGLSIFWQIDEDGRVRTGKMMRYKVDGHRDRLSRYNFDWVHSAIERHGGKINGEVRPTLFGMHLLKLAPNAVVNIVESEKTALIMSIAYGNLKNHIWMACGGLHMLSMERLKPIFDDHRIVILYPDKDAVSSWEEKVKEFGYAKIKVASKYVLDNCTPDDGAKADVADIVVRLLKSNGNKNKMTKLQRMIEKYPIVGIMVDQLGLIEV